MTHPAVVIVQGGDQGWDRFPGRRADVPQGQGGSRLAVSVDGHPLVARKVAALPCVTVTQDGDDGLTAVFELADFDAVAALVHPRRKRVLSEANRAALVAAGRAHSFQKQPG
jgi:hypothetical protein